MLSVGITGSFNNTNQAEKQQSFFNTIYTKCKFTPMAIVAMMPAYTFGTNTSDEWVKVTRIILNTGTRVSVEVPFQMSNTRAFISFRTSLCVILQISKFLQYKTMFFKAF